MVLKAFQIASYEFNFLELLHFDLDVLELLVSP